MPPERPLLRTVTVGRATLSRYKLVQTTDAGTTDSGWSDWGSDAGPGSFAWFSSGFASKSDDGSSFTKMEFMIETAAGIGRPWQLCWRMYITDSEGSSFGDTQSLLLLPGDSGSVVFEAGAGEYVYLDSAATQVIADG